MLNTTRTPVKLYKWDDPSAPKIEYAYGSVKTILKACLVSGYGEGADRKEPLGWSMLFEEADQAVFQSKAKENEGWSLSVVDSYRLSIQADSHVLCTMIQNPTSISQGGVVNASVRCGLSYSKFSGSGKWWLIGSEKGFILITSDSSSDSVCGVLGFGLFPSLVAADSANWCLYFTGSYGLYGYSGHATNLQFARNYEGLSASIGFLCSKGSNSNSSVDYPGLVSGGFVADDCLLSEWLNSGKSGDRHLIRGRFPMAMMIYERMPENNIIPFGTVYSNLDGSGDRYLYFKDTSYRGLLVNIDAWEM